VVDHEASATASRGGRPNGSAPQGSECGIISAVAALGALHRPGVTRVLVPSAGNAGSPTRMRGPEDLAGWTKLIEQHA